MGTWRLVLAFLVVANHTSAFREMFPRFEIGKIAVCAFFFISGFLMPLTFDTHYRRYGIGQGAFKFYINRFLRIYPVYWASLVITLLCAFVYGAGLLEHARSAGELRSLLTYLPNFLLISLNQTRLWGGDFRLNPPAWTLDVELQYYLLVPMLLLGIRSQGRWFKAALLALGLYSLYAFFRPPASLDIERTLPPWAFFFLLGQSFYLVPAAQSLALRRPALIAGSVLFLVMAALSRHPSLAVLLSVLALVMISAHLLVRQQSRAFGALDRLLGDLSYPTYILHWICIAVLAHWLGTRLDGMPLGLRVTAQLSCNLALTLLMAYAAVRLIGDPIEAIRRRIRDQSIRTAAQAPAHAQTDQARPIPDVPAGRTAPEGLDQGLRDRA